MKKLLDKIGEAMYKERDQNNDDQGCAFAVCALIIIVGLLVSGVYVAMKMLTMYFSL